MRQLGSEISRCNVAARNMTQVLRLAVGARCSVEPASSGQPAVTPVLVVIGIVILELPLKIALVPK